MSKKKKNIDIRMIIARPILLLIAVTSLLIFTLFNCVLIYSIDSGICNSLDTAVSVFHQFYENSSGTNEKESISVFLDSYLDVSDEKISRADWVITDIDKQIIDCSNSMGKGQATELISKISDKSSADDISRIKLSSKNLYYVKALETTSREHTIYILVRADSFFEILSASNRALLTILISLTIVSLIISYATATHVSAPIKQLSTQAETIGEGIMTPINTNFNCIELNNLKNSLNSMVVQLQAYSDAQKVSMQNVSHEMRTPLMSIQGYAEGIKCGYFENEAEAADIIIEESKRLSAIVDQILILSRLDTLNQEIHIIPINLQKLVRAQVENLKGYSYKESIKMKEEYGEEDIIISADEQLLNNIVINILSNGIRYAKSKIEIAIYKEEQDAVISITDDGEGLGEEDIKYLFTRFYKGKSGNFGLGMSIAKSATEYMGGTILAENTEQGGARFIVRFPIK